MAFVLNRQSIRPGESARPSSVCRVHTCARCTTSIDTAAPCSFVPSLAHICVCCAGQEQVLAHLSNQRSPWGAALACTRRA
jgi:hypothetical protein